MQNIFLKISILLSTTLLISCQKNLDKDLYLTFNSPAQMWEECIPLGNGRLGAMSDGKYDIETIYLNEETMWSGSEWDPSNKEALEHLSEIRQKLIEGKYLEAQELTQKYFICSGNGGCNPQYGCYQALAQFKIDYSKMNIKVENNKYKRILNMSNAVEKSVLETNNDSLQREYFVSIPNNVIVIKIKTSKTPIDIKCNFVRDENFETNYTDTTLIIKGTLNSGNKEKEGVKYFCKAKISKISDTETIIYISASTNYKDIIENQSVTDYKKIENEVEKCINQAQQLNYNELKQKHITEHKKYFDRVKLELRKTTNENQEMVDSATLYLQYGRYLLIASSINATLPPNLQGIWADKIYTAWNGDYHLNINVEMNHWPMEIGNLSDLNEPITKYTERLAKSGEKTAKDFYGTEGWTGHVLANAWYFSAPAENPTWGSSFTGGAWIALQLWEHYQFTNDKEYLKRVYPILKGAAKFLQQNLFTLPQNGYLITGPSTSPENAYLFNGKRCNVCAGPTMDIQICKEIFNVVIKASEILNIDQENSLLLKNTIEKLPPMQISEKGYLQEWMEDYEEIELQHRHVSHLFGLYPGTTINSPELYEASKQTLLRRGDGGTGWSRAWKINFWARLLDGNHAYKIFQNLITPVKSYYGENKEGENSIKYSGEGAGTFPNLFCSHPPFQIDGNFGGSAGLMEMLLQSHQVKEDGTRIIRLLPAIPEEWSSGYFEGLKARGNITVSCKWENHKIVDYKIENPNNIKIEIIK
ncbi:MAG: glycoside hydrolase family 95 protein [Bacteroidales bacterium]|nr:glycoside hydrolase family 95 protein [Bacteroidales bacterium]